LGLEEVGKAARPWFEVGLGNSGVSLRLRKPQLGDGEHEFHVMMESIPLRLKAMLEGVLLMSDVCAV
jgi:hypothetical protein